MAKLIIGIVIGALIGIFGTAMAAASHRADDRMDEIWRDSDEINSEG